MAFKKNVNRLILTDKGVEISKDIKKEILANTDREGESSRAFQTRSSSSNRYNLPTGYQAQLQSRMSVHVMTKPFRSSFLTHNQLNHGDHQGPSTFDNEYQMNQTMGTKKEPWVTKGSFAGVKSGFGSSTFFAVNNKRYLDSKIAVDSLGGLKVSLTNFNYTNEMNNQSELQKQQMQVVQQERLSKKYSAWNDKFEKSSNLMKTKYYQKYEDIAKLGDKEDENNFWKQWRDVGKSCDQCIQSAEQEHNRFEESLIRKLNNKYTNAFKTLPNCAKIPPKTANSLPKLAPQSSSSRLRVSNAFHSEKKVN